MRALLLAVTMAAGVPAMAGKLDLSSIYEGGGLNGPVPRSLKISPDGQRVTFLRPKASDQNRLDLWEYHVKEQRTRLLVDADSLAEAEQELGEAERARRERARTASLSGIVDYHWSPDGTRLLFPIGGALYLYDLGATEHPLRKLDTGGDFIAPQISPAGGYVSFVREQDLWVIDLASGTRRRLTRDGGGTVHNGEAEFVAQEEMHRDEGYWWAPDDSAIAFQRYDEAAVPVVRRMEIYAERAELIEQRYPAAGQPNVETRLGLVTPDGGDVRWIDLGEDRDIYLARVKWLPDARRLSYQIQPRDQKRLDLKLVDVATLEQRTVLSETSQTWVELNDDLHFLAKRDAFVWGSERTGLHHLYLYDLDGTLKHAISRGDWNLDGVAAVDEKDGLVYVTSNRDFVPDTQIYALKLDGSSADRPQRISSEDGTHAATFAKNGAFYVDTFSDPRTPPQVSVRKPDGSRLAWIEENRLDARHPYARFRGAFVEPEFGTLKADDGQTLYYRLYRPADAPGADVERRPVLVFYYGGPGVQTVTRSWGDHFNQYMAQRGYVVFTLDNRGMARRGRQFSDAIHRQLGDAEVADQRAGIRWLKQQPFVDAARIGVFGWSYGGYLTTMMLSKASDEIAAGVAVAPVTDWSLYDTHYTERYLSTPADNPAGYIRSTPFAWLDGLNAPLLLVHGMADDNVLFTNSTRLMAALQDKGTQFELMTYPGGKHGLSTPAMRMHVYTLITDFLDRKLRRPAPER